MRETFNNIFRGKKAVEVGRLSASDYDSMLQDLCRDNDFSFIVQGLRDEMEKLDPAAKAAESKAWTVLKPSLERRLHVLIAQFIADHPEASTHFSMIVEMERAISDRDKLEVVRAELDRAYNELFNTQVEV